MLMDPAHYHVRILPDKFKAEITANLEKFIIEYNEKHNTDIRPRLTYIMHELSTPFNVVSAKRFIEVTRNLDHIRNENTFTTIPEMNTVKSAIFGNTGFKI
jgi:hypothetical protein